MHAELAIRFKAHSEYSEAFMQACPQELALSKETITALQMIDMVAKNGDQIVEFYALKRLNEQKNGD